MPNDEKNIFIAILILLVLGGIFFYNTNYEFKDFIASSIPFYDPYLIEYDLNIPSQALNVNVGGNPACVITVSGSSESWVCNDGIWKMEGSLLGTTLEKAYLSNGKLMLDGRNGAPLVTYLPNMKNKDIKLHIYVSANGFNTGSCNSAGASVKLNGVSIPYPEGMGVSACGQETSSRTYTIELIKDVTNSDIFAVMVNGEYQGDMTIESSLMQVSMSGGYGWHPSFGGGGEVYVDSFKSKPYFSCQVDNDEVVVRKRFGEGSTFNKDDLDCKDFKCEPTKYCPSDYPAVVRNYLERGVKSDIRGTITDGLSRGEYFTVPQFQSYEIQWITKYEIGMKERCEPFEYYDTETDRCLEQGFLFEPSCFVNSDCWVPTSCSGVTAQCIDGNCVYSGDCVMPPTPSGGTSIWNLIASVWNNFWNWVRGLFL